MINKGQWVILPASIACKLRNLRISPPGVVPQRDRRPRWICDYTWSGVNPETINLVPREAMQFGRALDRILREILLANPQFGPVYQNKTDLSDGFYRDDLAPDDCPKLGVVFPSRSKEEEPLVAIPLVLPMGWSESPPAFSAITETIADVANDRLRNIAYQPAPHHLDDMAAAVILPESGNSPRQFVWKIHQLVWGILHTAPSVGNSPHSRVGKSPHSLFQLTPCCQCSSQPQETLACHPTHGHCNMWMCLLMTSAPLLRSPFCVESDVPYCMPLMMSYVQ